MSKDDYYEQKKNIFKKHRKSEPIEKYKKIKMITSQGNNQVNFVM